MVGGGTTLTISIIEQVTRTSHTPTRAEVRARDRYYNSFRVGDRGSATNRHYYSIGNSKLHFAVQRKWLFAAVGGALCKSLAIQEPTRRKILYNSPLLALARP